MKNLIIALLILPTLGLAQDVNPNWIHHPSNGMKAFKHIGSKGLFPSWGFKRKVKSFLKTNRKALQEVKTEKKGQWKLTGFNTNLGLGLSGKLGVVSWGGTKAFQLFWNRAKKSTEEAPLEKEGDKKIDFADYKNWEAAKTDIVKEMALVEDPAIKSQALEQAQQFFDLVTAIEAGPAGRKWRVGKLQLMISLGASVPAGSIFTTVGGGARLWLFWKRRPGKKLTSPKELTPFQKQAYRFITNVTDNFESMDLEKREKFGFKMNFIRVGLGVTAKGSIGIASANGMVKPIIEFNPVPKGEIAESTREIAPGPVAMENGGEVTMISQKRLKRGMKKALRLSDKLIKTVSKEGRKAKNKKWEVGMIWSIYTFSVGGSVGAVTLNGAPMVHFSFKKEAK